MTGNASFGNSQSMLQNKDFKLRNSKKKVSANKKKKGGGEGGESRTTKDMEEASSKGLRIGDGAKNDDSTELIGGDHEKDERMPSSTHLSELCNMNLTTCPENSIHELDSTSSTNNDNKSARNLNSIGKYLKDDGDGQNELETLLVKECEVCYERCALACKVCQKVFYCSKAHQVSDWTHHRSDCFPAILAKNENGEKLLIATRNISQGERILKDKPFIMIPTTKEPLDHICLGCYEEVETSVSCSKCKWDICSAKCEKDSLHSEYECNIFAKNQVLPPTTCNAIQLMDAVAILRCLLMKERQPDRWRRYTLKLDTEFRQDLLPMMELKEHLNCQNYIKFIRQDCGLTQFDGTMIERINRIVILNRLHVPDIPSCTPDFKRVALLFKHFIVPGTSCIPNARWAVGGHNNMKYVGVLGASVDIKKGEQIHCGFTQNLTGTYIRRQIIRTFQGRECKCSRCQDPTEFSTYLTAIKCRDNKDCHGGNFIPENPLNNCTEWKCDKCGDVVESSHVVTIISRVNSELMSIGEDIDEHVIHELENVIKKYKGTVLHENHFLILDAEYDYCQRITQRSAHFAMYDMKSSNGDKVVEFAKHLLSVTESILPGLHRYKGRVVYFLQIGLLISIFGMKSNQLKKRVTAALKRYRQKKYAEVLEAQKLAVEHLKFEPEDSDEFCMVQALSIQLEEAELTAADL